VRYLYAFIRVGNNMQVGIILSSRSQWATMQHTAKLLVHLGISYEARIITANKNANKLYEYANKATNRGLEIIIVGSKGEAYLPEILASKTELPVLVIQIENPGRKNINHYSNSPNNIRNTIDMPDTGPEGAINAALFAANMLVSKYPRIRENLINYRFSTRTKILRKITLDRILNN